MENDINQVYTDESTHSTESEKGRGQKMCQVNAEAKDGLGPASGRHTQDTGRVSEGRASVAAKGRQQGVVYMRTLCQQMFLK